MRILATATLLATALFAPLIAADPGPACVKSRGEARARVIGYDHVVILESGCDRKATCVVRTDVAPEPITAEVPPRKTVELTTFRGSPATAFTPRVECELSR